MISTNFLEYYGIVGAVPKGFVIPNILLSAFIYCILKTQFSKTFTNENQNSLL
jgi:hypothetical protein